MKKYKILNRSQKNSHSCVPLRRRVREKMGKDTGRKKIPRVSPWQRVKTTNMIGYDICRDSVKQRKHTHQETEPYVLYCTGTRIVSDNHIS